MLVKNFSIFLSPCDRIVYILMLLNQDRGRSEREYKALKETLERYVDVEEFTQKYPIEIKNSKEWLIKQLRKPPLEIWEEVKPLLFKYVANLMVNRDGYFDCYAISAYKRICKILIEQKAFEYIERYSENLRICKGKVREEFLKRYRFNEKPRHYKVVVEGILGKPSKFGGTELTGKRVEKTYEVDAFSEREAEEIALNLSEKEPIVFPEVKSIKEI